MLALLAILASVASDPPQSPASERAVAAFADICLSQRTAGFDATQAAIERVPGVVVGEKLVLATGAPALQTFSAGDLEYMLRPGRGGAYCCFVAYEPEGDDTADIVAALNERTELQHKPLKATKQPRYEWYFAGGGNDGVIVTPDSHIGSMLLNLEVGRK